MATFGSVKRLRAASAEDLARVDGIGPALAAAIVAHLGSDSGSGAPVVNLSTGEIVESEPLETDVNG